MITKTHTITNDQRQPTTRKWTNFAWIALLGLACAGPVDDSASFDEGMDAGPEAYDDQEVEHVEHEVPSDDELEASESEWLDDDELADLTPEELEALESGEPLLPALTSSREAATGMTSFRLPFGCGQTWRGNTRGNHSPANAIDFNHPRGDFGRRVRASAGGRVIRTGNTGNSSYGRWIEIAHGNGYTTRYAHLSRRSVRRGQRVRRGRVIGRVGNSGGSSGSHLHFELRRFGGDIRPRFGARRAHFWGNSYYTRRCR